MYNYNRTAYIRGLDLQRIPGVSIDTIRPDALPERSLETATLAETDGEKLLGSRYGRKMIYVNGHINLPDRWDYEMARDELIGMVDSETEVEMMFEQGGKRRRYFGAYENISITYKERGFVLFTITYRATLPYGTAIDETHAIQNELITDAVHTMSMFVTGNYKTSPRVVIGLDTWYDSGEIRTISLETESEGKVLDLSITHAFAEGSTIVIDGDIPQVTVNGLRVAYTGRFPIGKRTTHITYRDNASGRQISANVRYNERNI